MAKWSDYGLSYVSESNKPTTADILSSLLGSNDSVLTSDTFKQLSDSIDNEIESRNNLFSGLQSNEDLLSAAKNYNKLDTINQKVYSSDLLQGDWINRLVSPISKGISTGSSTAGWKGMLAGLFGGAAAGVGNIFTQERRAEEQAKEIEKIRNDINSKIENQTEYEQYLFDTSKQNIASNMNRQAWANMAAFGGPLHSYGADWRNGLVEINNGGAHEANPYEGVPFGISPDGGANLVEEGEVIWNDYVFSNRMNAPEDIKKQYKLGGKMNTFADIARYMKERYDERPNDPIAKRTLEDFMSKLAQSQEVERQKAAEQQAFEDYENLASLYADGGNLNRKEDYGSKKKPYPKVDKKDFAGGGRSYPIPTKADAVDALRLAGLHHRPDVKAKVYKKYPELKHALGGHLHWDGNWLNNPNGDPNWPDGVLWSENLPKIVPVESSYNIPSYNWYYGMDNPPIIGQEVTAQLPKFEELPETKDTPKEDKAPETKSKTNGWNAAGMAMRLASALGPALGALSAAWSKPKYEWADELKDVASKYANTMSEISYKPIGQYLSYRPLDRNYYLNRLDSQLAANRRAAMELSGGNRASALAGLNASDMAALDKFGQLARTGEEYNAAQREKVAAFNRDTDKTNSMMDLEAQKANASIREAKAKMQLQALMQALGWNRQDDMYHSATLAQNLTQLFDNVGGIGKEILDRQQQQALVDSGVYGIMNDPMLANLLENYFKKKNKKGE